MDRDTALAIVNALRSGTVPPEGLEHFAVGLEPQTEALREQRQYVARGRGAYSSSAVPMARARRFSPAWPPRKRCAKASW